MDAWAKKDPQELLSLYGTIRSQNRKENLHSLEYIQGILNNKGYKIVIEGNTYKLHSNIPQDKQSLYDMPIKELMNLHHKLVTKENIPYIPFKLRKTLVRRTKDIIINRGYRVDYDANGVPEFRIEDKTIIDNQWVNASENMQKTSVYWYTNISFTSDNIGDSLIACGDRLFVYNNKEEKENVNPNKENMKNIVIKFENKLLLEYVANKLITALTPSIVADTLYLGGKYHAILIGNSSLTKLSYDKLDTVGEPKPKLFTVSSARTTDTIIDEVIKEYNKVECKQFHIDGSFGGRSFDVIVYPTYVEFAGHRLTFNDIRELYNAANTQVGLWKVGGVDTILLTHASHNEKIYISRQELESIQATVRNYQMYNTHRNG